MRDEVDDTCGVTHLVVVPRHQLRYRTTEYERAPKTNSATQARQREEHDKGVVA